MWMLRVQKLIPRVPPRILAPAIRLMASKRFVNWSFRHYLEIAPPRYADRSAQNQIGTGQKQGDAGEPREVERDLVQAE